MSDVQPGQFTSTETVPAGWNLTKIECDDNNSTGDLNSATATFNVEAGETVTCTFTNTEEGTLKIVKKSDGGDDQVEWDISGDPTSATNQIIITVNGEELSAFKAEEIGSIISD